MIDFTCSKCGRAFSVPESFSGRHAKCKSCGTELTVPAPRPTAAAPARLTGGEKLTMRTRRLIADAQHVARAFRDSEIIQVKPTLGDPPEVYQVDYRIRSLDRDAAGKPVERLEHRAEIRLISDYPRLSPQCKMLTSIFHPNIDPTTICVGDHWAAGERLSELIVRIGEMIAYQAYNIRSPLDAEAAMWADLNVAKLPIDPQPIRPAGMD